MKAIQQLLFQVEWGHLDYLIIDMPPGTGDTQLTIGQILEVSGKIFPYILVYRKVFIGAIIISTPQEVAVNDTRRGIAMFQKIQIPVTK